MPARRLMRCPFAALCHASSLNGKALPFPMHPPAPACRGHMGGLAGGAVAALLLGPRWKTKTLPGKRGRWLVDEAPLPWLRSSPKPISGGSGRLR